MPLEPNNPQELFEKGKAKFKEDIQNASDIPDSGTNLGLRDYELEKQKASLEGLKQDIRERKRYANMIFWLIVIWLLIILVIVVLTGLAKLTLSDAVLIALITTTTANIAAFFLGVVKYLFPNHGKMTDNS